MVTILPPGPEVPAALRELLQGYYQALLQLQQPGAPTALYTVATASALPPAGDYPGTFAQVTDIGSIVHSVETAPGVWEWLRADETAL